MAQHKGILVPDAVEADIIIHFDKDASKNLESVARKSKRTIKEILALGVNLAEIVVDENTKGISILVVDSGGNVKRALRLPSMIQ